MRSSCVSAFISVVGVAFASAPLPAQQAMQQAARQTAQQAAVQTTLTGVVTGGGTPLPGCSIALYSLDGGGKAASARATQTGVDGRYVYRGLTTGQHVLLATCAGQRVFQGAIGISGGPNERDIALDLDGTQVRLSLERILVEQDGSAGKTTWRFDILQNSRTLLSLPNASYDDGRGRNDVPLSGKDVIIFVPRNGKVPLRIVGTRDFGGDTATGDFEVTASGGMADVKVQKSGDGRGGSFVFSVATTPAHAVNAARQAAR